MSEESDEAESVEFEITPELVWWMTDVAEDVFKNNTILTTRALTVHLLARHRLTNISLSRLEKT